MTVTPVDVFAGLVMIAVLIVVVLAVGVGTTDKPKCQPGLPDGEGDYREPS